MKEKREFWTSRIGFIAAAIGSAVGLGNIWRFPYEAAGNGGGAFLLVNFIAVLLIGLPAMLAEFTIGRGTHRNVVDAYGRGGHPAWKVAGLFAMATSAWVLAYYSVVGGWVTRYLFASATGSYFGDPAAYFDAAAAGTDALFFHTVFMLLTVGIVALGIERGIELGTKLMVPAILVLMIGLAIFASTLPGATAGYRFFLNPDFQYLSANLATVIPAAVGEVLFTLSLGFGAMITYASYIESDHNLVTDGIAIVIVNTLVGYLAGLVVFPLLFAQNVEPGSAGAGAIFVSIATAFQNLPAGEVIGVVFYFVVLIAALSSSISLLEIVVAYFLDNYDVSRPVLAFGFGAAIFLLGVPTAYNTDVLTVYDSIASEVMLPIGILLATVFAGWVYGREAVAELGQGVRERDISRFWLWHVRSVLLAAVVLTLVVSFASFAGISLG